MSTPLPPAVEEFLLKFEAMAPAVDWTIDGEPAGWLRTTGLPKQCPLEFVAGSVSAGHAAKVLFEEDPHGRAAMWEIANAADTRRPWSVEVRRRLLAACGLADAPTERPR